MCMADGLACHLWSSVAAMDDGSMRISDDDREQAVVALREHLLAGRLTLEEFSERVEAALRARVGTELVRLKEDLPDVFVAAPASRRKPRNPGPAPPKNS
jgi:hypothetical protein